MNAGKNGNFSNLGKQGMGSRMLQGKSLHSYLLFPAFSIFVLAVIWVATTLLIKAERKEAERASGVLTQELLATYEAQATRALREIDQTLKVVKYANESTGRPQGLSDLKSRGLLPPDLLFVVLIADTNGRVLTSSRPSKSRQEIDGKLMNVLRHSDGIAVSTPFPGTVTTEPLIQFGRRLAGPDGSFAGVVAVSVAADYFVSGYEPSKLGADGVLAVLGVDGIFRAKRTGGKSSFGAAVDYATAAPNAESDEGQAMVVVNAWDGVRRYTGARKLYDFPLTVIVGLSEHEQLATYHNKTNVYLAWAAAGSVILIFFATVVGTLGWRLERSRQLSIDASKSTEDSLRVAAAAFESQEAMIITDARNVILQVNQAFMTNTGYSASEALGKTPRLIRSDRHDKIFQQSMWDSLNSTGVWKGELWNRHKDGTEFPAWSTISAVKNAHGEVTHYVGSHFDITARKQAEKQINHLAYFDQLTGLPNRTLLLERLSTRRNSLRDDSYSAMLFIDLDNFKRLNDTLGHGMGDALLIQVAQRLTKCVRGEDTVARLGGDEFVVLLFGLGVDRTVAATLTESIGQKILSSTHQPYPLGNVNYRCSSSIGATLFKGEQLSIDDLMKQSDLAMYRSKAAGRNSFCFFDPLMETTVMNSAALENDLTQALDESQLILHYQAQILDDGRVTGAEALVRWQHPTRGMVPPFEFIPLAEECGLIQRLGLWVLHTACDQLVRWSSQPTKAHLTIAVNVSARQFHQSDFVDQVLSTLQSTGARPDRLKLELTESLLVDNVDHVVEKMSALKAKGVSFSLDDFGTGYSSLSYLKRLPLDQLKIDKSFVRDVHSDPDDAAIVRAIVTLANALNLNVIAEGVETQQQREFLVATGCREFQGYYFAKPVPIGDFEAFAEKHLNALTL